MIVVCIPIYVLCSLLSVTFNQILQYGKRITIDFKLILEKRVVLKIRFNYYHGWQNNNSITVTIF